MIERRIANMMAGGRRARSVWMPALPGVTMQRSRGLVPLNTGSLSCASCGLVPGPPPRPSLTHSAAAPLPALTPHVSIA